jgi:hypothetical protein
MDMGSLGIMRESSLRESGWKISSMVLEKNIGRMELFLEDIFQRGLRSQADFLGLIKVIMKDNLRTINLKVRAYLCGRMAVPTRVAGKGT